MNIFLESVIWSDSFDYFKWQIENSNDKIVDIYIASMGGNVDAGFAIANYIEGANANGSKDIRTHILSNADSIATVIFLAAEKEKRSITGTSTMFIHEPRFLWCGDVTIGDTEKMAKELRIQEERIADYYVKKIPGLTKDEATQLMSGETTLTASDMLDYGIVSEVKENFNIAAFRRINNKSNYMFNKKTLQTITLKQGDEEIQAVFRGEKLAEKVELERIGGGEALDGDFLTDNQKVVIENNKVKSIEDIENPQKTDVDEQIEKAVEAAVSPVLDLVEKLAGKVDGFLSKSSNHKPEKTTVRNEGAEIDPQKEARKESKDRQKENYKKRTEKIAAKVEKFNVV